MAHWSLATVFFLGGIAAFVLYRFPPTAYCFYPLCPIHEYLHFECPGCGTTRALAALLHGQLREALRLNALAVGLVLPIATGYGLLSYVRAVRMGDYRWPQLPMTAMYASVGLMLVFTVMRNL